MLLLAAILAFTARSAEYQETANGLIDAALADDAVRTV